MKLLMHKIYKWLLVLMLLIQSVPNYSSLHVHAEEEHDHEHEGTQQVVEINETLDTYNVEMTLGDFKVAGVGTGALSASTVQLSQKSLVAVPYSGAELKLTVEDGYQINIYSGNNNNRINQSSGWLGTDGDNQSVYTYTLPSSSIYMRVSIRKSDGSTVTLDDVQKSGVKIHFQTSSNIVDDNKEVAELLKNTDKAVLLHISDVHGDVVRAERAAQFAEYVGADALLVSGDLTAYEPDDWGSALLEGFNKYDVNVLYGIGNHDANSIKANEYSEKIYTNYYSDFALVSAGQTYYMQDLNDQKLRILSVNQQEGSASSSSGATCFSQTQIDWLINALKTTPEGYGVVMMYHSSEMGLKGAVDAEYAEFFQTTERYNNTTSSYNNYKGTLLTDLIDAFMMKTTINDSYSEGNGATPINVVADFSGLNEGVEFIAHVSGHMHADSITYLPGAASKQLMLNITCATASYGAEGGYAYLADVSDLSRNGTDASQDAVNAYVIDRQQKSIQVVRIGASEGNFEGTREEMTIPYSVPFTETEYPFDTTGLVKFDLSNVEWVNYGIQANGVDSTYNPDVRYSTNAIFDVPYSGVIFYIKINAPYELGIRSGVTETTMNTNYYWLSNKNVTNTSNHRGYVYQLPASHEKFILSLANITRNGLDSSCLSNNDINELELLLSGVEIWYEPQTKQMTMQYDDHLDMTGKTVEILDAGTPTSYQVGYGVEENTVLDSAVVTLKDNTLVATGVGRASVSIDGVVYDVTVETAPLSLILLAGQSNMQGSEGDPNQSIVCPDGMVYATYGDRYNMTESNASNYVPSSLTGQYSSINVNGTTTGLSDYPVYLHTDAGTGKAGPDSGFAYEWVKQTGEKIWIVNTAHGGTSITKWAKTGSEYKETLALFTAVEETLQKEIAAGHYSLSYMGYYWCQGCSDHSQTAQWYVDRYLTLHHNLKTDLSFDHDQDPSTPERTFEFGGIIPVRTGHASYISYREGISEYTTTAKYHESFLDLRMTGPRVAQYWMTNNPELEDIWLVCNIGEDWVTMPDGTDGVSAYFNAHYENGTVDYTPQVAQKTSWYTPTTPAAVHDSIHYNQIGYNEVGRESVRNTMVYLGINEPEDVETTVELVTWDGITLADELKASKVGSSGTLVVPKVYPVYKSKEVTYELGEGLSYNYYDLLAESYLTSGTLSAINAQSNTVVVSGRELTSYQWELKNGTLISTGKNENKITRTSGKTENGLFIDTQYAFEKPFVLLPDENWLLEWKMSGAWIDEESTTSKKLFNEDGASATPGASTILVNGKTNRLSIGYYGTTTHESYGVNLNEYNIDVTQEHTYRLYNVVNEDNINTIYLFVDGQQIGPMTRYFTGSGGDMGTESNALSGREMSFGYMGTAKYSLDQGIIEYITVIESGASMDIHIHDYTDWTEISAPTKDNPGVFEKTCSSCGDVQTTEVDGVWQLYDWAEHINELPENYCSNTNLWLNQVHDDEFFTSGTHWSVHSSGNVTSITIPVHEGDQLYATSFGKAKENGHASSNGIRMTWFDDYGVLKTLSPSDTYEEFSTNGGYLVVPEGAKYANIPMWNKSNENEVYILNAGHDYESVITAPTCTEQGYTTHTCSVCGDSYVDSYVDASGHEYVNGQCVNCGQKNPSLNNLKGKKVSIIGDSISTFGGVSNNSKYNSTIVNNAVYYSEASSAGVLMHDTWWQQVIDVLDMELLVNNSWSGSCVLQPRKGEASIGYKDRCVNLHNDNTNVNPDIIFVYLGTNDFKNYPTTIGTAEAVDYDTLIIENSDGSFTYSEPVTTCEAYAIMLHKMKQRYPEAEIYTLTTLARKANASQPTAFNADLIEIAERFNCSVVDLETCGITSDTESMNKYMYDGAVHPNKEGMDLISEKVISVLLNEEVSLYDVEYQLDNVSSDNQKVSIMEGQSFTVKLSTIDPDSEIEIKVFMDNEEITESCYENGKVYIDSATGDIVINASSVRESIKFRWEYDSKELVSVFNEVYVDNTLTKLNGTTSLDVFTNTYYQLEHTVELLHEKNWILEWKGAGEGGFMLSDAISAANSDFYFRRHTVGYLNVFGYWDGDIYNHYGVKPSDYNIDARQEHIYRLENRVNEDGSNMVYFYVDGNELGAMNHYYIGYQDQKVTDNWLSGKDFYLNYIGTSTHPIDNYSMEYLTIWEDGCTHEYSSVITAPTCTEQGYTTYTCSVCGDSYVDNAVAATGHEYGQWQTVTLAEAAVGGTERRECEKCDVYETCTTDPLGHESATADVLSDGEKLTLMSSNYVITNKHMIFEADVDELGDGIIRLGHGKISYSSTYLEITATEIRINNYTSSLSTKTYKHGLTIDGHIRVMIDVEKNSIVTIETESGIFSKSVTWNGRNGEIFCEAEGTELTNVDCRWYCDDYDTAIWFYGDSWFNTKSKEKWPTYMINDGHTEVLFEGYPGMGASAGLAELKRSLEYGIPEYAVWCLGMNNSDGKWATGGGKAINASWLTNTENFIALCEEKGIIPILVTIPSSPVYNHSFKNEWIRNSGYRYVDVEHALVEDTDTWTWFDGFMTSDGGHTAASGAYQVYLQMLVELPEIFNYPVQECSVHSIAYIRPKVSTCETTGYSEFWICTVCGELFNDEHAASSITRDAVFTEKLGHEEVTDAAVDATCTETGLTEGKHCERCVEVLVEQTVTDKLGHDYESVITEPTCTTGGFTTHTCERCDDTYTDAVTDKLGHNYTTVVTAPTCEETGYTTYTCARCDDSYVDDYTNALGHNYGIVVTAPNCISQGYTTYTCVQCSHSYQDHFVDSTGEHDYVSGTCTGCGHSVLGNDWIAPEFVDGDYSMVVVPDPQRLVNYHPEAYYDMMQWIVDNEKTLNIQAVLNMGDMTDTGAAEQWVVSKKGMDLLNSTDIAWMPMMGNHDDSAGFNSTYDYATYGSGRSWFGGSYQSGKLDHTYWFVDAGDRDYLVFSLGWMPTVSVLSWAEGILQQHPDKNVIVTVHAYMNSNGALLSKADFGIAGLFPQIPDGQQIWDTFKKYENVVLMMSGHVHSEDIVSYVDQNAANKDVASLLLDRQNDDTEQKLGTLAIFTFHEDSDTVEVNWYSTKYDAFYREKNQLTITVPHTHKCEYETETFEATCTEGAGTIYTCTLCGKSHVEYESEALGHKEVIDAAVDATCTETGLTEGKHCERCDEVLVEQTLIDQLGHQYESVVTDPTCTTGGYTTHTCERCDDTYTDAETDKLGHEYTSVVTEATCEEAGYTTYTCTRGDDSYVSDHVDALGHAEVLDAAEDATCTETGLTEGKHCGRCGEVLVEQKVTDKLGHDYAEVVVDPTCTESGYTKHICTRCDDVYEDAYVTELGHHFGEWFVSVESTYETAGEERRDCERCDAFETRELPVKQHSYTSVVVDPTCTEAGYTLYTCTECGNSYQDNAVKALGHSYGSWTIVVDATHDAKGTERRDCVRCDAFETREIAVKEHVYSSTVIAPTCTTEGYTVHTCECGDSYKDTYVSTLSHNFGEFSDVIEADCFNGGTKVHVCETCGFEELVQVEPLGHKLNAEVTAPSCTEAGYTTYTCQRCGYSYTDDATEPAGHDFGEWIVVIEADCVNRGMEMSDCQVCEHYETRYSDALGHDYESVVTAPDCRNEGYTTHTCTRCSDSYVDSYVESSDHGYGQWLTVTEATCTTEGLEKRICTGCGREETRTIEINDNHKEVVDEAVDASCTESGLTEGSHCERCGEVLVEQTAIDKLGHDYESVVTEATCTEKGYTTHTCTRCSDSYVDEYTDKAEHDYGLWFVEVEPTLTTQGVERRDCENCEHFERRILPATQHEYTAEVIAPTCTDVGYTVYTCTKCNDTYRDHIVDALGHELDQWVVIEEGECTKTGIERRDCVRCDHYEIRSTEAPGHDNKETVIEPTCTQMGYTIYECQNCKAKYEGDYVEALGHTFGEWYILGNSTCGEKGAERRDCEICDGFETREAAVLEHTYEEVVVDATCTEAGKIIYTCSRCNDTYTEQQSEPAGHSFGEWKVKSEATCTQDGTETRICEICDETEERTLKAKGHKYVDKGTAATCTENGVKKEVCERCSDAKEEVTVQKLGHSLAKKTATATCTQGGYELTYCQRCDYSKKTNETSALGHSFGPYVSDNNATADKDGTKTSKCTTCGSKDTVIEPGTMKVISNYMLNLDDDALTVEMNGSIDRSKLHLIVNYTDGTSDEITDYELSDLDASAAGKQDVSITYRDYSDVLEINVIEADDAEDTPESPSDNSSSDTGEPPVWAAIPLLGGLLGIVLLVAKKLFLKK